MTGRPRTRGTSRVWGLLAVATWALACEAPGPPAQREPRLSSLPVQVGPFDALSQRFGRLRQRLERRGYAHYTGPSRLFTLEGKGVALPVDLATSHCTTFVALAGGDMHDLEVALFDTDGAEVTRDDVHAGAGLLHVCPQPGPERRTHRPHYLTVRALDGSGAVIVEGFRPSRPDPEGFAGLFEEVVAPPVPLRDVERKLAHAQTTLRGRGWRPLGAPVMEGLAEGEVLRDVVELEAGRCYAAVVRSAHGLADLALFLFGPTGAEIARDLGGAADATLEHCAQQAGRHTLEVRAFEGLGAIGLLWMQEASETVQAAGEEASGDERRVAREAVDPSTDTAQASLESLAQALALRGYGAPRFVVRDGALTPGEVARHEVLLPSGCSVIAGATDDDALDLDLYLTTAEGRLVDRDTGVETGARVGACPRASSTFRIIVKAYGRDAGYAMGVFGAPPAIRSLQTLRLEQAAAAFVSRGYRESWRMERSLAEGAAVTRTLTVEAGGCAAWIAAGDQHVEDVDLFVRDAEGELLVSETGAAPYAAASRCPEADAVVRVEASVYAGDGDVVLAQLVGAP